MKLNLFIRIFHFLFDKRKKKPVLLIFVGDLVLETLHANYRKWSKKCDMCYLHTDMGQLPLYEQYKRLKCLYIGNVPKNHCGERDFESGRTYFRGAKEAIFNFLAPEKYHKIIIVSTLRFSSACGISTELYVELRQSVDNLQLIGIKPLQFEGVKALSNFEQAINLIAPDDEDKIVLIDPNCMPKERSFTDYITEKVAKLIDYQLKQK